MTETQKCLLVVDDNAVNRDILSRRLQRSGYAVIEAARGQQALEILAKGGIDLVLLDIMMPDMDGLQVLQALREDHPPTELPVIMITGKDGSEDMVQAFSLGANDYVTKPIDFAVTLARIQAQLGRQAAGTRTPRGEAASPPRPGTDTAANPPLVQPRVDHAADANAAESEDLPIGTKLANYLIAGVLGRGGMGVVYEAKDTLLSRDAALKVLSRALSADSKFLARFQLEAKTAAKVEHPNIVSIYEVGHYAGVRFIAMELVRGASAQFLLDEHGPFPWKRATQIIAEVCQGLAAAHACQLIHRDIKPDNIMVRTDGVVKVTDFGLAKVLHRDEPGGGITDPGMTVGTPWYMSPEQCRCEPLDARSDIYSLGGTYYALLTRRSPYQDVQATWEVMSAHCTRPVPDPRKVFPLIPANCSAIIQRAMAKERDQRYQSVGELLEDLKGVLAESS